MTSLTSHSQFTLFQTVIRGLLFSGALVLAAWVEPAAAADKVGPETETVSLDQYNSVFYVAGSSDSGGEGTSKKPFRSIKQALSAASKSNGNRAILVAEGTYSGETLEMVEGVDLFGGFSSSNWDREIEAHPSILDGEEERRVIVGANNSRLDGFTITGGRTDGFGAGMLCESASPEVSNNVFEDNSTVRPEGFNTDHAIHQEGNGGGGITCIGSSPTIRGNRFVNNRTEVGNGGGVLCLSYSSPQIENNLFGGNVIGEKDEDTRSSNGGAIGCSNFSSPHIVGNVIVDNYAGGRSDGGGIYLEYHCFPRIENNLLSRNTSGDDGAAIYAMKGSHPVIAFNTVVGNAQGGKGGSTVRLSKVGSAALNGNRIVGNHSIGFVVVDSWADLSNNIFAFNHGGAIADTRGKFVSTNDTICDQPEKGISVEQGTVYLTNAIVSGNGTTEIAVTSGGITLFNCLVKGGQLNHQEAGGTIPLNGEVHGFWRGFENFDSDPGFEPDSWEGSASSLSYDEKEFATVLKLDGKSTPPKDSLGGPIRIGDSWGIVSKVEDGKVSVWGNFVQELAESISPYSLFVPPSYRLNSDSSCVDTGKNLGAPLRDIGGHLRPIHRVTNGTVDVGAYEVVSK